MTGTGNSALVVYKRLWGYTKRYKWMFLLGVIGVSVDASMQAAFVKFMLGVIGVSVDASMQAAFVKFMEPLIDRVFVGKDSEYGLWMAGFIFVAAITRIVGNFVGVYSMEWVGRKVVADLRQELFNQYVVLPASYFDHHSSGQLISKLAYNSEQVANAATRSVIAAFRDVILVILMLTVMLTANVMLSLVMLLLVPIIGLLVTVISSRFRKISHRIQDSMGDVSHLTEEAVVGQQVIKVFQGQDAEKQRFSTVNEKTRRLLMRMLATRLASSSMVQLAAGLALVLLMVVATRPSMLNDISAGSNA